MATPLMVHVPHGPGPARFENSSVDSGPSSYYWGGIRALILY